MYDSHLHYLENKEKIKRYNKQYRITNREKIRIRDNQYNIEHKEVMAIKAKQRRLNNIEIYKERERNKKYTPEAERRRWLKNHFGMSIEEYKKMFNNQNGKCIICNKFFKTLCVDHDHLTGKIRGLLCHQCNLVLGNAKDNVNILENAIKYLNGRMD